MEDIIITIAFIGLIIWFIYDIVSNNKQNTDNNPKEKEDNFLDEKREFYNLCYGNNTDKEDKELMEIGEWEKIIKSNLHPIVDIKNQYIPNKNINILIGDYNKQSISNSVAVLESMGLNVTIAQSGLEIIQRIQNGEKYDAIITNNIYDRGGYDGLDVLRELKKDKEFSTPIIALTVAHNARILFLEKGFDEYMDKLLEQEKVLNTLPNVIVGLEFSLKK